MTFNAPLGDAYVRVSFDTSGLAAQTQQIKRNLSATLNGLATQLNKFGMLFTRYLTLPIAAAFAAILKDVPEIKWAFSGISDAITRLTYSLRAAGIIDFMAGLIDKVRQFIDWLATLDPATLRVGTAFLILLASIGPLLKVLSFGTKIVSLFSGALTLLARHPLVIVALGVVALIDAIIILNETTESSIELFGKLTALMGGAVGQAIWHFSDQVKESATSVIDWFKEMYDKVVGHSYVPDMAKETVDWFEWMGEGMKRSAGGAIDWVDRKMSGSSFVKGTQAQGKDAANRGAGKDAFGQIFGGVKFDIGKSGFGIMDSIQQGLLGFVNNFFTKMIQNLLKNTIGKLFENTLGGLFGGLFSGLGFAGGGRPPMGKASLVGERGPELFVPDSAGTIVPNDAMGGASVTQIFNVSTGVSATVRQELRSMMPMIQSQTLKAVQEGTRRGGTFSKGVRGF